MESQGVIRKVDKPTDWVHPIVIVDQTRENYESALTRNTLIKPLKENISNCQLSRKSHLECLVQQCSQS